MYKNAIVLTGGIATGKSTVANLFMLHGFLTIDADKIAHEILDKNAILISSLFGKEYIKDNKVIRRELGNLIFNNIKEKRKLEKFIHPLIKEQIIQKAKIFEKNNKPYLIDIPLFFENKNYDINRSIVVYASKNIQIKRLILRDKLSLKNALSRINNQMSIKDKKILSTYIIDNCGTLKDLINEVQSVKDIILKGR
jgi:dephospho-CoA kinase